MPNYEAIARDHHLSVEDVLLFRGYADMINFEGGVYRIPTGRRDAALLRLVSLIQVTYQGDLAKLRLTPQGRALADQLNHHD